MNKILVIVSLLISFNVFAHSGENSGIGGGTSSIIKIPTKEITR